jgi:hypothetical protein
MGIFKKLIDKVLDAEVPPAIEKLVRKEHSEKKTTGENLKPNDTLPFAMVVENVSAISGMGTVVAGKIQTGAIKQNEKITIIGGEQYQDAIVIAIEKSNKLGKLVCSANAGEDVRLLLNKINKIIIKKDYVIVRTSEKMEGAELFLRNEAGNGVPQETELVAGEIKVIYGERYIPDDSDEAKQIRETEQRRRNAIISDMISHIEKSPYFKPGKKPILIDMLKKTSKLHDPFLYDDCLTATEKKALGLNSRLKISRQMVDLLNYEGLKLENPKEIMDSIYYAVCSKQSIIREPGKKADCRTKILRLGNKRD